VSDDGFVSAGEDLFVFGTLEQRVEREVFDQVFVGPAGELLQVDEGVRQ